MNPNPPLPTMQQRMAAQILRLAPNEGLTPSALDGVRLMRANRSAMPARATSVS